MCVDVRKENRPCKRDGEGRLAIKTIKPSLRGEL